MPRGGEAKARAFYGELLELIEIPKPEKLVHRGGVWFKLADSREIHLGVEEPFNPAKKAHPAFVATEIRRLARRLEKAGYPVQWDDLIPGRRRFYTADPFGNRLELLEFIP
ncbi:MAG TPA: glyoxalase [Meiothermus sp.]|nr:glyoxalase [Meiothermus sp.]